MFNSKNETVTLAVPATANQQSEQVVSFRYSNPGLLQHQQNYEDFSTGVEHVLQIRGFHLLPGSSDILSSWHDGSSFIVVIRGFMPTSVVYCNDISLYRHFMKEWSPAASAWHLVAPFPRETTVDPSLYRTFDPRRGF